MSSGFTSLLIIAVGAQLALQAPINSALGQHVGKLAASFVSFLVGTAILLILVFVSGEAGSLRGLGDVPAYELAGGLIGATYVATATFTVARIGAGAVVAATITGQLLSSLAIDDFGLVGVDAVGLDGIRILGALLLLGGTLLVVGQRKPSGEESTGQIPSGQISAGPRGQWRAELPSVSAVFGAGLLVGFQHPLNGLLSESAGELGAGLCNFVVGTAFLLFLVLVTGRGPKLAGVRRTPAWQFLGGLIGVITVVAALSAVSVVGAAGLTAALVTGQLLGSILIDRAGAFGLPVRLLTARRMVGTMLLLVGTVMCVY